MKFKLAFSTATALGLLMSGAMAGDNNRSKLEQTGDSNSALVVQDGTGNYAGENNSSYADAVLRQTGNHNVMDIEQTGNNNRVGDHYGTLQGAHQSGNRNVLTVEQETGVAGTAGSNGNIVWGVRQSVTAGSQTSNSGTTTTNEANITQKRPDGGTRSATHFIGQIHQTLAGLGAKNLIDVVQIGENSSWYGGQVYSNPSQHGNRLTLARQNGTGNTIDVEQKGTGVLGGSGDTQLTGPRNAIHTIDQTGQNHTATVHQDGYRNYVEKVEQSGSSNKATIILGGEGNGANNAAGVAGIGAFTSGRGAELAGAAVSTVRQSGTGNEVHYTVEGANYNQFGFFQDGTGNKAVNILIKGDRNELGVYQDGTNNELVLSTILGKDNIIGLRQVGTSNVATVNISQDRNGGYHDFTIGSEPLHVAGNLASNQGLTAGLLQQRGVFNQVTLNVNGSDNTFASLQDNSAHLAPTQNVIIANVSGNWNQAAIVQAGNNNYANLTQNGGSNNAAIQQGNNLSSSF